LTLKEIIDLAYFRCDEDIEDRETMIDKIVINAINQGYCFISTTKDKKTKVASLTYSEKISLPTDYFELVEIKHSSYGILAKTDYLIEGDLLIPKVGEITTGTFTLTYIFIPVFVTAETTALGLKDIYCTSLAAYAAYQYMLSQKQYQSATMFLNEFNMILNSNTTKGGIINEA